MRPKTKSHGPPAAVPSPPSGAEEPGLAARGLGACCPRAFPISPCAWGRHGLQAEGDKREARRPVSPPLASWAESSPQSAHMTVDTETLPAKQCVAQGTRARECLHVSL